MSVGHGRTPPVRTPDPLSSSRRRALRRLGSLRAMGLGAIGDIGSHAFSDVTQTTVTWETATDWDSNVSESGVVHESTTNTDHTDATVVKQGYPFGSPLYSANLELLYALHEDSGTTANDLSGNGNNGSVNGATLGVNGVLGTTGYSFDGTDDYVGIPDGAFNFCVGSEFTLIALIKTTATGTSGSFISANNDADTRLDLASGEAEFGVYDGGNYNTASTSGLNDGVYHHVAAKYDTSFSNEVRIYMDGSLDNTASGGSAVSLSREPNRLMERSDADAHAPGDLAGVWGYSTALTDAEISTHADVVLTAGSLTTDWKTLDVAVTSLDTVATVPTNTTLDITVEQDTDGDGTVENTQTVSVADGSDTNSLSGFTDTSGRYRLVVQPSNSDRELTASLDSATIVG